MDIERAKAVANVAKVIVESAKVEVAFLNAGGGTPATGFIPDDPGARPRLPPATPAPKRINGETRQ